MSTFELKEIDESFYPENVDCGEKSIQDTINASYLRTLYKQSLAYCILVDGIVVGSCMLRLCHFTSEDYYEGDTSYTAFDIEYVAIDRKYQHKGYGKYTIKALIALCNQLSEKLPIRFLVLHAFPHLKEWYMSLGFEALKNEFDESFWDTIPMYIDFLDIDAVDAVLEQIN